MCYYLNVQFQGQRVNVVNKHRGIVDDSDLASCKLLSFYEQNSTFRKVIMPSFSIHKHSNKNFFIFLLVALENKGSKVVRNVRNHPPIGKPLPHKIQ